jgi:tRNA:m4X modification enzyme
MNRPYITVSKQLDQLSSLLGHMEKGNMLQDKGACFVEFGAGRGIFIFIYMMK